MSTRRTIMFLKLGVVVLTVAWKQLSAIVTTTMRLYYFLSIFSIFPLCRKPCTVFQQLCYFCIVQVTQVCLQNEVCEFWKEIHYFQAKFFVSYKKKKGFEVFKFHSVMMAKKYLRLMKHLQLSAFELS